MHCRTAHNSTPISAEAGCSACKFDSRRAASQIAIRIITCWWEARRKHESARALLPEQASVVRAATPFREQGAHCLMVQAAGGHHRTDYPPAYNWLGRAGLRGVVVVARGGLSMIRFALGSFRQNSDHTAAVPAVHGRALTGGIATLLGLSSRKAA